MSTDVSKPQLQACRTCEHGRTLKYVGQPCNKGHAPHYVPPESDLDDQHGFHRHCADWKCRPEVVDAEVEDGK